MGAMMEAVQAFFTAGHWPMTEVPGHPLLRLGFASAEGSWNCLAHVREAQSEFLFYSVCPFNVPDPRRATMAEFLTRANYGLALGNFEKRNRGLRMMRGYFCSELVIIWQFLNCPFVPFSS